ncbi:MAG: taurine dioxygenase [Hyphomicrobiaceae bacterium TMED74]|nr:taurine dioxygenase [Filomicrobium sp.]RPG42039.1 MAG: taurine dioxygenase [Hyphomicrobiaceae bacterium TMED74]
MTERHYETIQVEPLNPVIGAEISGVDLRQPLGNQTYQEIHDALSDHLVVFFRDQDIDWEQQKAFGRSFGELHIHPTAPKPEGHPEILVIKADGESKAIAGNRWHSDVSCDAEPPMGSILHMHELPPSGGDTMFANMYAAYEALSEPMKDFLSGLSAWHESEHVLRGTLGMEAKDYPRSLHPVVRTHPVTKRKCLFVNSGFTTRIDGLAEKESRALLDMLFDHVRTPEFHCRFRWQPKSIAFWDNRCAQHYALWDYFPKKRLGYRVTVCGDRPV